jgi:hypothetical protein
MILYAIYIFFTRLVITQSVNLATKNAGLSTCDKVHCALSTGKINRSSFDPPFVSKNNNTLPNPGPDFLVTNQAIFNEGFSLQGYDAVSSGEVNRSEEHIALISVMRE